MAKKLNLGCGKDIREGWINLDVSQLPGVDVVHDVNILPLPFGDGEFDEILARDVLEHVEYIPLLADLHRLLCVGGELKIQVPHFSSPFNYIDPTHQKRFAVRTFDYFLTDTTSGREYYFGFSFASAKDCYLSFLGRRFEAPIEWAVNRWPRLLRFYEMSGLCRLFPAGNIRITLVK